MTPALRTLLSLSLCPQYSEWIASLCRPYLGEFVVEVGCGIGNVTRHLGAGVIGVDCDEQSCHIAQALTGIPIITTTSGWVYNATLPIASDTIVLVNVLEHLERDVDALKQMHKLLAPGGHLCLLVPQGKHLYGSLDKSVGHYRRYSMKELRGKMVDAGFSVVEMRAFNPLGIIGWAVSNLLQMRHTSLWSVMAFDALTPLLKHWRNPRFGLSIFAVGVK